MILAIPTAPARAQGGEFDLPPGVTWDQVNKIAHQMYCDVCEGVPLDECESVACRQWREEIARQLGEGRTEDQIIDYFVENFGADVAALPRDATDRFISFAVPVIIALIMGMVGAIQVRQMRARGSQPGTVQRARHALRERPVPDDVDPALIERLIDELAGVEYVADY
ncbi:MAG: cytochrome c-type biogenesis protein CcmH [Anaerolineae bacterium]|nr:cytochrome c-type biogenesis protein CcmH [Anaerolineae bacterium]